MDTTGVTGLYRSAEGKTGDDVWATRADWVSLAGEIGPAAVGPHLRLSPTLPLLSMLRVWYMDHGAVDRGGSRSRASAPRLCRSGDDL